MAKEYPWLKFKISDWMMGKIQRQKPEVRGVFLDLICRYWQKQCELSIKDAKDELDEVEYAFDALISKGIIKIDGDNISIAFLDEQWAEREGASKKNSENGQTGGRPVVATAGRLNFYLIRCQGNGEDFLKVGISSNTVYRRYGNGVGNSKAMPYPYTVIFEINLPFKLASELETAIQTKFLRYNPKLKFSGYMECVCTDIEVVEYITQSTNQKPTGLLQLTENNPSVVGNNPIREDKSENKIDIPNGIVGLDEPTTTSRPVSFTERCNKFIQKFNELRGSKFQATDNVKGKLKARLKTYSSAQIIDALKRAQLDEYHISTNFKYLTPEYILRVDILERFLNAPDKSSEASAAIKYSEPAKRTTQLL